MMKNIALLFLLASSLLLLLAQIGEVAAAGAKNKKGKSKPKNQRKDPKIENLSEIDRDFHTEIVFPMEEICANKEFAAGFLDEKEALCANVIKLANVLNKLALLYKRASNKNLSKKAKKASTKEFDFLLAETRKIVTIDLDALTGNYEALILDNKVANTINRRIEEMANGTTGKEDLNAAFIEIFDELKELEENEVVYESLCIAKQMRKKFEKNAVKLREWAYQQFVANLVIHSISFDISSKWDFRSNCG